MQENHCFMKISTLKRSILYLLLSFKLIPNIYSQSAVNVVQDSKFEQLLNDKRKINATTTSNDRFRIQIFNGETETAKTTLADFRKNNKNIDGTIVFFTPIYKVWVGNFKTRIEAEKNMLELKKKYPLAFLIRPQKN